MSRQNSWYSGHDLAILIRKTSYDEPILSPKIDFATAPPAATKCRRCKHAAIAGNSPNRVETANKNVLAVSADSAVLAASQKAAVFVLNAPLANERRLTPRK